MPVTIEAGCIGFQVMDDDTPYQCNTVAEVHAIVDHHYRNYLQNPDLAAKHRRGEVAGCPVCEKMRKG